MMIASLIPMWALSLSVCGLAAGELLTSFEPSITVLAERQIATSISVSTVCTTGTSGVVSPTPSSAVCGVAAVSNGGVTIISYSSGSYISSLVACSQICLQTVGCTNLYFTENEYCNLHSGAETHVATANSIYTFYDASCFSCSSLSTTTVTGTATKTSATASCATNPLGLVSPQPSGAVCDVLAYSNGGTTIISYTSEEYVISIGACADACLTTAGCTNLYFVGGEYCNLHAGNETHNPNSASPYTFYDASCFICPSSCGLASPQPSGAVCDVIAYSNGGTTIISYNSGEYIESLDACGEICLKTTNCTNLYFAPGEYCNLHSGTETHNPDSTSPFIFYDASCFECPLATTTTTIATTKSSTTSSTTASATATTTSTCTINADGLASPQPSGAVCDVVAYSNGGTTIISYNSGDYIASLAACGEICLETSGCTNIYFDPGVYCNLHSGTETHNPDSTSPYIFYDVSCFECPSATVTSTATTSVIQTTGTPWASIETDTALYNMAITTTYTQAAECTGGAITQMAWHGTNLWENNINPVPTSTVTTCYPSQFYSSVMGEVNSVSLPAFNPLVCPSGWSAAMYNSTYGVCCPNGFGVDAPYYIDMPDRPFYLAGCTSIMGAYQVYTITSYDSTAYSTVVSTRAPTTGTFVRANAFDGFITGLPTSTITTSTKTTSTSTSSSTSSSTSACATPVATVAVTFQIKYTVLDSADGESISLYGSTTELGSWVVNNSLGMSAAFYTVWNPLWEVTVDFAAGEFVQYSYIHNMANGTYNTTSDPDYNITVSTGCSTIQTVLDVWR